MHCDCAIIGGGIAGLWLLNRLRQAGFSTVLIESQGLGAGQTLCSQGIIHGGVKYSLHGTLSGASQAISAMPERWRACLEGRGELDLSAVYLLSEHQYLFTPGGIGARLTGFFASKALRSHIEAVDTHYYPTVLADAAFRGQVYCLAEPVLQVDTLLAALADKQVIIQGKAHQQDTNTLRISAEKRELTLRAKQIIWTAGAGNSDVDPTLQQLRPLHMVLVRGDLPVLYGHCLGTSDKPRLTVSTHHDQSRQTVWYIGGLLAEDGTRRERAEQIQFARTELNTVFPWINWDMMQFSTFRIDRAEGCQSRGQRPDLPVLTEYQDVWLAWPTKLALAPLLADQVLARLRQTGIQHSHSEPALPADWPRPKLAPYPWERDLLWT